MTNLDILKERLARGEITLAEFNALSSVVGGKQNAADALNSSVNVLKKSAAVATDATLGAIRNILGPDSVPYPTNSAPLEVTKDFSIFGDFLVYKGKQYSFREIASISFFAQSGSVNFIPSGSWSDLKIKMESGDAIKIIGASFLIKGKKNKLLSIAHNILSEETFPNRLSATMKELTHSGFITVDGVRITRAGNLIKGGTTININKAWENETLVIGTYQRFGANKRDDPWEIIASETGLSILSSRIIFSARENFDVIVSLLNGFKQGSEIV